MKTTLDRAHLIHRILSVCRSRAEGMYRPVVRHTPEGVAYWVSMTRDGITVGRRFPSRDTWQIAREGGINNAMAEFQAELEAMPDERLESQADYWLPKEV